MNLLILSLLMAFGGQTTNSDLYYTGHGASGLVGILRTAVNECEEGVTVVVEGDIVVARCANHQWIKEPCQDVKRPEISLHPYPLWRIEAQEPETGTITVSNWKSFTGDDNPPIDVPAVQEEWTNGGIPACIYAGIYADGIRRNLETCESGQTGDTVARHFHWTCSDPSRSLESSVDGLKHWCHRMSQ